MRPFSLSIVSAPLILTNFFQIRWKTEVNSLGSMSDSNYYKEKDGGARLGATWHGSIEGFIEWGSETSATELRSVGISTVALSSTVPAAHIQEQSRVP